MIRIILCVTLLLSGTAQALEFNKWKFKKGIDDFTNVVQCKMYHVSGGAKSFTYLQIVEGAARFAPSEKSILFNKSDPVLVRIDKNPVTNHRIVDSIGNTLIFRLTEEMLSQMRTGTTLAIKAYKQSDEIYISKFSLDGFYDVFKELVECELEIEVQAISNPLEYNTKKST